MIYVLYNIYKDNTHVYSIYIVYTYMSMYIYIYMQYIHPELEAFGLEFFEFPCRASLEVCCPGIIKTTWRRRKISQFMTTNLYQKLAVQLTLLKNCHFQVPSRWFLGGVLFLLACFGSFTCVLSPATVEEFPEPNSHPVIFGHEYPLMYNGIG